MCTSIYLSYHLKAVIEPTKPPGVQPTETRYEVTKAANVKKKPDVRFNSKDSAASIQSDQHGDVTTNQSA